MTRANAVILSEAKDLQLLATLNSQFELSVGRCMKKHSKRKNRGNDRDTMRPEYDFSSAVRGATAARYAQGANVAVIDDEVLDVFPDGSAVNQALRALAPVLRQRRAKARRSG